MEELLFEPLVVKNKVLRNRIVLPPMVANRGITTPAGLEWYARRAYGGAAMVIIEASDVVRFGSEFTPQNLRPLVEGIHAGGALAAIQIFPGRRGQHILPADLSLEDIHALVKSYILAVQVCMAAGFDGVEPHGAHGYLLTQFFSLRKNLRQDDYGQSLTGRARLALEIVSAIQPVVAQAGGLLLYRHTPVGYGIEISESVLLAQELVSYGVDILDISPASYHTPADRAAPFMPLGVPVIAVNNMHLIERAVETLREKCASLVAVGRGLIADPDWPRKVQENRLDDIIQCISCPICWQHLDRDEPVECGQWNKK